MIGAPAQDLPSSFALRQHFPSSMSEPPSCISEAPTGKQGGFICGFNGGVEAKWRDNVEELIWIDSNGHRHPSNSGADDR